MHFPRYWALGTSGEYSCWQWSDFSVEDAKARAEASAAKLAAARSSSSSRLGRYEYGHRLLREPIVEEFALDEIESRAVVTRNSYGALVLNTTSACFVDIDLDENETPVKKPGIFASLFGARKKDESQDREKSTQDRLDTWFSRNPSWGARLYRTRGGFRLLITSHLVDPLAFSTEQIFGELQADPLYCRLCKSQESFRARLTPKPWRIDRVPPSFRWPFFSEKEEACFHAWEVDYRAESEKYATCRFIREIGSTGCVPGLELVIERHDSLTAASTGRILA